MLSKRAFISLTLLGCTAASLIWMLASNKPEVLNLPIAETEFIESFVDQASCLGRPKPASARYASVQKGGRLEVLAVKVGDQVAAGQILAVVDKTVNSSNLKSALSSFRLAQKDYNRMAGLARSGSASREELDKAQSNFEVKRAELERAKQGVEDSIIRASHPGRVAVLVFKVGDKIPDGSRVAAIESPAARQMACRIPTPAADSLGEDVLATWTALDNDHATEVQAPTTVIQAESGDFVGIDREIRLISDAPGIAALDRRRVQVKLPLTPRSKVTKVPSEAVIKRSDGFYTLLQSQEGHYAWAKVEVLRRDAFTAYVTGLAQHAKVLRLTQDLTQIETMIANTNKEPDKG